jgi:hypothetical protein
MNAKSRKWTWALTDDEKFSIAASVVCIFLITFLLVFAYFGEAPKQIPVLLATGANLHFLRKASVASTKYVDIALSTFFFSFVVVMNIVP